MTSFQPEITGGSFEIVTEIRFSDALSGSLFQFLKRARYGLLIYGLLFVGLAVTAQLIASNTLAVMALGLLLAGLSPMVLTAGLIIRDQRKSGGSHIEQRYHVCPSGIEVFAAGKNGWHAWEDLWDAEETSRSFLISPSPQEQDVVPKRCCSESVIRRVREYLQQTRILMARES